MSAPDARPGPSDDGANQVWGLICTLVAGPAVWGAVGFAADELVGTGFLTPVGVVVGFVTSFFIVYRKATYVLPQHRGRSGSADSPGPTQHGRSASNRDAARPDPGDGR